MAASRTPAVLTSLGLLFAGPLLGAGLATVFGLLEMPALAVTGALLGGAGFFVGVAVLWVFIFAGHRALRDGEAALLAGDVDRAEALARKTIRRVVRADYHTRSAHLLGLCAEARGDFAAAADLFARAGRSIPLLVMTPARSRARALALGHATFALAALGRVDEARRVYAATCDALVRLARPAELLGVFEQATESLGAVSMSGVLAGAEPGRDPRAVALMAKVLMAYRERAHAEVGRVVGIEAAVIERGLLPRERALVREVEAASKRASEGLRGAQAAVEPVDAAAERWVRGVLAADGR